MNLSGTGPFIVGQFVNWRLCVRSAPQSSDPVPLESLVVTDLLPEGLTFSSWTFDDRSTGLPAPQIDELIPNFAGTGRTLVRRRWNAGSGSLGVNQEVWINMSTTVNGAAAGAPVTALAPITNTLALDLDWPGLPLRCSGSSSVDTEDRDGDGDSSEILCTESETINTFNPTPP